jgi:transcription termination/antitermination protein NusA
MKLTKEELDYITLLEKECSQTATACIKTNNSIVFLAQKGKTGAVVGKQGENVKKISLLLKKPVEVFEYANNAEDFIQKAFNKINGIETKALKNALTIKFSSLEDKKKALINKKRMQTIKEILNKCFGIEKIKIL